jgi:hypothetical protein
MDAHRTGSQLGQQAGAKERRQRLANPAQSQFGDGYPILLGGRDQVKALLGRAGKKTRYETQWTSHQIIRRRIAGLVANRTKSKCAGDTPRAGVTWANVTS